jgi:hypothetical protein
LQIKTKIVSCHIADSKPVKQEVNGTVILPALVFPDSAIFMWIESLAVPWEQCHRSVRLIRARLGQGGYEVVVGQSFGMIQLL